MIKKGSVYIMESAEILGDVTIAEDSSVWNKVVIRGDESSITIGKKTNVQDMCVLHSNRNTPMEIGENVSIGHRAIIHCRRVGSHCLIGMGAILLSDVEVGEYSIVAAGSLVNENTKIPPHSLVMGIPGEIVRETNGNDIKKIEHVTEECLRLAKAHYERKYRRFA